MIELNCCTLISYSGVSHFIDKFRKGGGFLDLRTIHIEEITRWVAEVEQSFDTVSRPRFGSPDTVTAKPIDHREKTRGLDKKSIMRIFGVASRPTARLL